MTSLHSPSKLRTDEDSNPGLWVSAHCIPWDLWSSQTPPLRAEPGGRSGRAGWDGDGVEEKSGGARSLGG